MYPIYNVCGTLFSIIYKRFVKNLVSSCHHLHSSNEVKYYHGAELDAHLDIRFVYLSSLYSCMHPVS